MTQNVVLGVPGRISHRNVRKSQEITRNVMEANRSGEHGRTHRKPRLKTSEYIGVSRHASRCEAFVWDNTSNNPGERGKTVYLGGFVDEVDAARARDLFAIKIWGQSTPTNFPVSTYEKELWEMKNMDRDKCLIAIRRMGNTKKRRSISRGLSAYRGVTRKLEQKKWQARLGKGKGIRGIYLGTFDTEEEAANAYDIASIRLKGPKSPTNFDLKHYDAQSILNNPMIPIGKGASKLLQNYTAHHILSHISHNNKILNPSLIPTDSAGNHTASFRDQRFPEGCSVSTIQLEDDTETLWNDMHGESLMDHMLNQSIDWSTADFDWSFTWDESLVNLQESGFHHVGHTNVSSSIEFPSCATQM